MNKNKKDKKLMDNKDLKIDDVLNQYDDKKEDMLQKDVFKDVLDANLIGIQDKKDDKIK
ncbi:hypothetical protein [Thermohalobacter berrensis]|uniref:hypothetical protein n=1 Tax=Thermohalobacter berrensis TaxID=99594 RepID=UPI00160281AD|nr:hypothetical protein [Thermohalobacter berrensis]